MTCTLQFRIKFSKSVC